MTTSRSFILLCTVGVFCFISYNMVRMPVLSLFAESLGASPERVGLIVSVSTLTGVFLKLPSGALSDIYGRRFLLQIGVVAFGLPPFLYPWVTDRSEEHTSELQSHSDLHSFPTRRSSDLTAVRCAVRHLRSPVPASDRCRGVRASAVSVSLGDR